MESVCEQCGSPQADQRYYGGETATLCCDCDMVAQAQLEYEDTALDIEKLVRKKKPYEAIRLLSELMSRYEGRNERASSWISYRARAHIADIWADFGHTEEALEIYRQLAHERVERDVYFLMYISSWARLMAKTGKPLEALRELDASLRDMSEGAMSGALRVLALYEEISSKIGSPVPLSLRHHLEKGVSWWGYDIPENLLSDPVSLAQAIKWANQKWKEAQERYVEHLGRMEKLANNFEAQKNEVSSYVDDEDVGFFRREAEQALRRQA